MQQAASSAVAPPSPKFAGKQSNLQYLRNSAPPWQFFLFLRGRSDPTSHVLMRGLYFPRVQRGPRATSHRSIKIAQFTSHRTSHRSSHEIASCHTHEARHQAMPSKKNWCCRLAALEGRRQSITLTLTQDWALAAPSYSSPQ